MLHLCVFHWTLPVLSTEVKMTKMKRNDNPWNEASSRVIIMDVPEQAARRRRSRRDVNFLAKMKIEQNYEGIK